MDNELCGIPNWAEIYFFFTPSSTSAKISILFVADEQFLFFMSYNMQITKIINSVE